MTPNGTSANFFIAYLAQSLQQGGQETEITLSRITTLTGEEVTTAAFSVFGRGIITIDPLSSTNIELASFTAVDPDNLKITGVIRGLSAVSEESSIDRMHYHAPSTRVIVSFGQHNLKDLVDYVAQVVEGEIGTADDEVAGSAKVTEDMGNNPRSYSALVSQQNAPDMTLKVNPFGIGRLSFTGGNTPTISAPVSNDRIDLVVYSTVSSAVAIRGGAEAVSPVTPTPQNGDIVLAEVYNRVGETAIYERDFAPNQQGYIVRWYFPSFFLENGVPAGAMMAFGRSSAPSGWLPCDGSAVSRSMYPALFDAIGTSYGNGDGSTTFNVPDRRGRVSIGAGTGTKVFSFSSRSSNTITITGSTNSGTNELQTGQIVKYNTSGTPITGLTDNTDYYVIRVAYNQFQLASSLANAQNGTALSLSSDGSGTQTFTLTLTARSIGDTGGEERHAMSLSELLAHSHTHAPSIEGGGFTSGSAGNVKTTSGSTSSVGGNASMNNMQPYGVDLWCIKY